MTYLVAAETLLLVLVLALVAGLLRSHAEILRRLGPADEDDELVPARLPGPEGARNDPEAPDVTGLTLDGDAVGVALAEGRTLLAFLTSGCTTCRTFWAGLAERTLPAGTRLVIVTKDGSQESPGKLRELAPDGVPVVLSSAAWADYDVPGSPYFVWVEGGRARGEGSASGWPQLSSLISDALEDERLGARTGPERGRRADEAFAAAGIGPGHPSLYPDAASAGEPSLDVVPHDPARP